MRIQVIGISSLSQSIDFRKKVHTSIAFSLVALLNMQNDFDLMVIVGEVGCHQPNIGRYLAYSNV